jgi:putative ABC transport system substrate-binding protein
LIGYEPDFQQVWRHAATFVYGILKGAKAGELPIDQSARSCMFVNPKTAKALGLVIPQAVLRQADEVIQ